MNRGMSKVTAFFLGVFTALLFGFLYNVVQARTMEGKINAANARAEAWELVYRSSTKAWEERALQFFASDSAQEALIVRISERNKALARDLESRDVRIEELSETVVGLRAALDSSATTVARSGDSLYHVSVDESVILEGGGWFRVEGSITLRTTPLSVQPSLGVSGGFPLTVVLTRTESGDVEVHAFTGDPRLSVESIDVQRVAEHRTGGTGISEALAAIGRVSAGPLGTIALAGGLGACLLSR